MVNVVCNCIYQPPVPLFTLYQLGFGKLLSPSRFRFLKFPFDGRDETGERALYQVVVGPHLHRLDRGIFTDTSGDDDEREIEIPFPEYLQGGHTVEDREHIIRNDEVPLL